MALVVALVVAVVGVGVRCARSVFGTQQPQSPHLGLNGGCYLQHSCAIDDHVQHLLRALQNHSHCIQQAHREAGGGSGAREPHPGLRVGPDSKQQTRTRSSMQGGASRRT